MFRVDTVVTIFASCDTKYIYIQLLSKIYIDSDFCHNYLHTLHLFECL